MSKNMIFAVVIVVILGIAVFMFLPKTSNQSEKTGETSSSPATSTSNTVTISNFAFSPATITIKAGESVTWVNNDTTGHTVTADDSSFDTGVFAQGSSKSVPFNKAGTYTYHCSIHPDMKGTVVVQ